MFPVPEAWAPNADAEEKSGKKRGGLTSKLLDIDSLKTLLPIAHDTPAVLLHSSAPIMPFMTMTKPRERIEEEWDQLQRKKSKEDDVLAKAAQEDMESKMKMAKELGMSLEMMNSLDAADEGQDDEAFEAEIVELFKVFDEDGSGDLSPEEVRRAMSGLSDAIPQDEIEAMIKEADADGDGVIDCTEFARMMKARRRVLKLAESMSGRAKADATNVGECPHIDMKSFLALPPLKLPKKAISKKRARRAYRPYNGFKKNASAEELRRELKRARKTKEVLDIKVRKNVEWVQAHCPVTSIRAQLYCKRWGAQKLQNLFQRIEFGRISSALNTWKEFSEWKRNQEHVEKYMKLKGSRRLTSLLKNWKRKRVLAAWNAWFNGIEQGIKMERVAAAIEAQRIIRGWLGKQATIHLKKVYAAIDIERIVRGFLGRCIAKKKVEEKRRDDAARLIQRNYRGWEGKKVAKIIAQQHREFKAALKIQGAWRGYTGRRVYRILSRARKELHAAIDIARVWRGYFHRQIVDAMRQAFAEDTAAEVIQTCWRGFCGRLKGNAFIQNRIRQLAQEEASVKIQNAWRRYLAKTAMERRKLHRAAVRVQTRWRAHQGKLAMHLKKRAKAELEAERERASKRCKRCIAEEKHRKR